MLPPPCSGVAGPVLGVKLIPDRHFQHGGLNYGFVEYQSMQGAENALNLLNGRKIFDTEIKVNWAYQNQQQQQREDLSNHFHVFVGDLSPEITDETLRKAFAAFGTLSDARVMWDLATGKSRGYGFLAFRERADAEQAITAMNGEWLGSRAIRVNWANQRSGGAVGGPAEPGTGASGGPVRISNLPPFLGPPKEDGSKPGPEGGDDDSGEKKEGEAGGKQDESMQASSPSKGVARPAAPSAATNAPSQQQPRMPSNFVPTKPQVYDVVVQQSDPHNSTVYVGNLVPYAQSSDLMPLFAGFGYVEEIRMQSDRGYAFVKLDTHQNAAMAIVNLHGSMVHGRPIKCSWGKDKLGSDTSIIAKQANGVTSPPLQVGPKDVRPCATSLHPSTHSDSGALFLQPAAPTYPGWPYAFPYGHQHQQQQEGQQEAKPAPNLTPAQAAYFAQYYGYPGPSSRSQSQSNGTPSGPNGISA